MGWGSWICSGARAGGTPERLSIPFRLTYKEFAGRSIRFAGAGRQAGGSAAPIPCCFEPSANAGTAACWGFDPAQSLNLEHSGAQRA
jgi:hypothetical protein